MQRFAPSLALVMLSGLLLFASRAQAFSLSPMSATLEAGQKNATQSYTVDNGGAERIAVQITMAVRKVSADGVESNPEADDDFIVYPSQLVLGPREKRSLRVTWAGDPKPARELAYRIIAEQLPVETTKPDHKAHAVIKMLLRYMGAVYITPRGSRPKVEVKSLAGATVKGHRVLALEVANSGTAHQTVKAATLTVRSGDAKFELSTGELKAAKGDDSLIGANLLAGGTRRFLVPWPEKLKETGALRGELEIKE